MNRFRPSYISKYSNLGDLEEKLELKDWKLYTEIVAQRYNEAPMYEEDAVPHWESLIKAIEKQFDQIVEKKGARSQKYKIEFVDGQPYKKAEDIFEDIKNNNRIQVSQDFNIHPVWTPLQNLKFRTVHDIYGHYHGKFEFGAKGEIQSYNKHIKTLPHAAIPAMFTEVVGQAMYAEYFGVFGLQKITILKGFDYINLGRIDNGYEIKNRELIKNGTI